MGSDRMSDHLPECIALVIRMEYDDAFCICPEIRACEQRVLASCALKDGDLYADGYDNALDAAREAVAAELGWEDVDPSDDYKPHTAIWKFRALAAIDALRGESNV